MYTGGLVFTWAGEKPVNCIPIYLDSIVDRNTQARFRAEGNGVDGVLRLCEGAPEGYKSAIFNRDALQLAVLLIKCN
jgi:hypothetical protein